METETHKKILSAHFGEGETLDIVFFLEPTHFTSSTESEKAAELESIQEHHIKLYSASKKDWFHYEHEPIGKLFKDFWNEFLKEKIDILDNAVSRYVLTSSHVYFYAIYAAKTGKNPSRPTKAQEQKISLIARKIAAPFLGSKVLNTSSESAALYTYMMCLDNYLEDTGIEIDNRELASDSLFSIFNRYINDSTSLEEIFRTSLMDSLKEISREFFRPLNLELQEYIDKSLKLKKSNYKDTRRRVMTTESAPLMSSRIFGLIWEAITKTPDWGPNEQTHANLGISNDHYVLNDKRGNIEAAFYLGSGTELNSSDVSLSTDSQTTLALQRWSIEHLRLYFAINFAISNSKSGQAELTEADLMYAAGYSSASINGNGSKIDAKQRIFNALNDLKLLHMHLVTKDQKYRTGHFPIYQIEPLPVFYNGRDSEVLSIRARVSLGLWARDFVSLKDGPNYDVSRQFFEISSKREPLSLLLAAWSSLNQYRIKGGKSLTIRTIFKEILPENSQMVDFAYSFSWEELYKESEGNLTTRTRDRRHKLKQDFIRAQQTLKSLNIDLRTLEKIRRECSWEDFLNVRVYLYEAHKIIPEQAAVDPNAIKKSLKAQKITQSELAEALDVSQSQISKWLSGKAPMPQEILEKLKRYADSGRK